MPTRVGERTTQTSGQEAPLPGLAQDPPLEPKELSFPVLYTGR